MRLWIEWAWAQVTRAAQTKFGEFVALLFIIFLMLAVVVVALGFFSKPKEIVLNAPEKLAMKGDALQIRAVELKPSEPLPVAPPRLGFIMVFSANGALVIYEAIKGEVRKTEAGMFYTNSEGVDREFGGHSVFFRSAQPLKLEETPKIATQSAARFRAN